MTVLVDELRRRVHRTGHFRLSSGLHSDTYLQCALALQDPTFARELGRALADQLRDLQPETVASPAIGGLLAGFVVADALGARFVFTERKGGPLALRRGQSVSPGERIVVVEDVVTTGGSARETAEVLEALGARVLGYGAIVDRSDAFPVRALVRVDARTWEPAECPLCAAGEALDAPGSRPPAPAGTSERDRAR